MNVRVYLAGEGATELGDGKQPGVLAVLLSRVRDEGWEVSGYEAWRHIKKFEAGKGLRVPGEHWDTTNVLKVAQIAKAKGCQLLGFTRDCDDDSKRRRAIEDGIQRVLDRATIAVIGGGVVRTIEAWILALLRQHGTEKLSVDDANEALAKAGKGELGPKLEVIVAADLDRIPMDARSLRSWLDRARVVLPGLIDLPKASS